MASTISRIPGHTIIQALSYRHRTIEPKITELTEYFPVVAVLGARQVGKTTLVQNLPSPEL